MSKVTEIALEAQAEAEALRISKATQRAESVLSGLFEWVGKSDGRTAFLFAVNTAMGGFALGSLVGSGWSPFEILVYVIYFVLFAAVSYHLIMVQYPNVSSPNRSILFFASIASHSFDDFVGKFSSMSDDDYLRDVLHQCHVNSLIVQRKFKRLKTAMLVLILSSLPWAALIAAPAFNQPGAAAFVERFFSPTVVISREEVSSNRN